MLRNGKLLRLIAVGGIVTSAITFVARATGDNPEGVSFNGAACMDGDGFDCNIACTASPLQVTVNGQQKWICIVFTGDDQGFNIKECITEGATAMDTCSQNLSFNNGHCDVTYWNCGNANIANGVISCSVANCACNGPNGVNGVIGLNPNCT